MKEPAMRKSSLAAIGLLLLTASAAQAADSATCVRRDDVRAWVSPQPRHLIVENYAHHKVLLTMTGNCQGFGPYDSFRISGPMETAASCIVEGDNVYTHWAGEPGMCTITAIAPYAGSMKIKHAPL
jgi:hypothetical protein